MKKRKQKTMTWRFIYDRQEVTLSTVLPSGVSCVPATCTLLPKNLLHPKLPKKYQQILLVNGFYDTRSEIAERAQAFLENLVGRTSNLPYV